MRGGGYESFPAFRVFWACAYFFLASAGVLELSAQPGGTDRQTTPREYRICDFVFPLPSVADVATTDGSLLELDLRQPARARWMFTCVPNPRRTSRLSELRSDAQQAGHIIHRLDVLPLKGGVEAALFSRTRLRDGQRIKTVEAYFATRDLEYHFFVLPHDHTVAYDELAAAVRTLLDSGRFVEAPARTITEAQYRLRLVLVGLVFFGSAVAGALWLLWRIRRRR